MSIEEQLERIEDKLNRLLYPDEPESNAEKAFVASLTPAQIAKYKAGQISNKEFHDRGSRMGAS